VPDRATREDCPLCLEPLPALSWRGKETTRLLCCGKELCAGCDRDFMQGKAVALSGQMREHTDFVRRLRAAGATGAQLRAQVAKADSLVRDVARTQKCPMCRAALPKDDGASFALLRRHAEDGHAWAQNNVAHRYETGRGVARDGAAAGRWFRAAAVQGNQMAQTALAQAHAYGQFGMRANAAESLRWYTAAAEQGNAKAMWAIGVMHRDGVAGLSRDRRLAMTWLLKSAELGCVEGQADLGCMYEDAGRLDLALQWTARAAEEGNPVSQNNVGAQLMQMAQARHGSVDVPGHSPLPLALRWLRKAAAQGETESVALLGSIEQQLHTACSHCKKPAQSALSACAACNAAFYCSKGCQRAHWKAGHKRDCGLDNCRRCW
jgi:TPR repeat protein